MIRVAHVSDIHITAAAPWGLGDWFSKRLTSWFNLRGMGRGRRFKWADEVLSILMRDLNERGAEHVLFSGDATALGFETELHRAAELLEVGKRPGLAVPGNHDYLTKSAARSGLFEKIFAPWQTGVRPAHQRVAAGVAQPAAEDLGSGRPFDETYPFAQRVGPAWVIGVNSAVGNFLAFDASGKVGKDQRERLRQLLAELPPGPRLLVTHYPVRLASGRHENRFRGLRDLSEVVRIAAEGRVSAWLHGHRHGAFVLPRGELAPFPVICVGSGTQTRRWSYNEYNLSEHELKASRRSFDPQQKCFFEAATFTIPL